MDDVKQAAMDEARAKVEGGMADGLIERLVDRIGGRTGVTAVFGTPVERDGITVIPVARVRWAFGAGGGSGPVPGADAGDHPADAGPAGMAGGSGGGGAAGAIPVGFIEIGPSGARFQPIADPYPNPLFLLAVGVMSAMVLRGVARILRG